MARRYASTGDQNAAASATVVTVVSATTIRPRIYEVVFGSAATPADQAFNMDLRRFTAAGTATAITPQGLAPADPAALASAGSNHPVEPTYTAGAILLGFSINQQAPFRWVASP